jgi:hypothetical protein
MTMTAQQSRAFERSSFFRRTMAKQENLFEKGMSMLKSIWVEEKTQLAAIWAAPDADEFVNKIKQVTPKADAKLVEDTIKAFEGDETLVKRVSEVVAFNRTAKAELAAQAKLH